MNGGKGGKKDPISYVHLSLLSSSSLNTTLSLSTNPLSSTPWRVPHQPASDRLFFFPYCVADNKIYHWTTDKTATDDVILTESRHADLVYGEDVECVGEGLEVRWGVWCCCWWVTVLWWRPRVWVVLEFVGGVLECDGFVLGCVNSVLGMHTIVKRC